MAKQININPGEALSGGPGVGFMTPAGNPWTVPDAVADDAVQRGIAVAVGWSRLPPPSDLTTAELAALRAAQRLTPQARNLVDGMSPQMHWGGNNMVAGDWSISSGSPTVTMETRNGRPVLKIVTGAGVTANVDLNLTGDVCWYGKALCQVEGNRALNVAQYSLLATPDNFTNFAQNTYTTQTTPLNNSWEGGPLFTFRADGQVTSGATASQFTGNGAAWGASTPALDGTVTVNKVRFRVIPVAGQVATVYLYGLSLAPRRRKGRVFVTVDDGYKSAVNTLLPIFSARGIPMTVGVIGNLMGNRTDPANYMSWADVRQFVAAGGQAVAHGPVLSSAAGNLIANYANNNDRVADMIAACDYIRANGADTPNFEKAYVWPQGNFQAATEDMTLLDAAIAAGFTVGRSASPIANAIFEYSALSKYQRLALPIIGHTYAGGTEAANITTIATAIGAAGTARGDCVLMFHKGVKNADTPDAIGITVGNAITLADAIVTEMNAGRLQAGVLGDLAEPSEWAL